VDDATFSCNEPSGGVSVRPQTRCNIIHSLCWHWLRRILYDGGHQDMTSVSFKGCHVRSCRAMVHRTLRPRHPCRIDSIEALNKNWKALKQERGLMEVTRRSSQTTANLYHKLHYKPILRQDVQPLYVGVYVYFYLCVCFVYACVAFHLL